MRTFKLILALFLLTTFLMPSYADEEDKAQEEKTDGAKVKTIKGEERSLTLSVGIARELEFPFNYGSIRIGDNGLFEFIRIKEGEHYRRLRIVPKNSGVTDMTIHDENDVPRITYMVRVTREDVGQLTAQLEDLVGDIEGLKIKAVGGTIILDGDIILPKDMLRINRVVDALKDRDPKKKEIPIRNLATISKVTMNVIAERIEREIGSPEITVKVINNNLFVEGTAESNFEADRAIEIAKTYLPEWIVQKTKGDGIELKPKKDGGEAGVPSIVDLLRVRPGQAPPPSQDVLITINYVELRNEYNKSFSFEWKPLAGDNSTLGYNSQLGEFSANVLATVSNLFPKLQTAADHGHARVLKQQQIVVKDNAQNPASIDSSIDIYSKITNEKGEASLQPIQVQNSMKVKASTLPGSDSINLGIQLSFNSLLGLNQGSPSVARNSLQTEINIKNGDSAAIGGYAIDDSVSGFNREPTRRADTGAAGGSNQSPLFNMSRSKGYKHDKQQYVIFVTPEILRTASSGTEGITRKFRLNSGER